MNDNLDEVMRGVKAKYKEIEKRFHKPGFLKESNLYNEASHIFRGKISNRLIKLPDGRYIAPEIVDGRRSLIDENSLLAYNPKTKKFIIASRKDCHQNPDIMHYGIYCFIHTPDRKYTLLQKRGETDLYALRWTCPVSGHVDLGESFLESLVREYKEELEGTNPKHLRNVKEKGTIEIRNENEWESKKIYDVEIEPFEIYSHLCSKIHGFSFFQTNRLNKMINENPDEFTEGIVKAYKTFF